MDSEEVSNTCKTCKHLVIPGGGISGLVCYGALRETHEKGIWNIKEIQTIYGTSVGAVLAVILALKYDWNIVDNYLIKRPWHSLCDFNMYSIIGSFQKRGIFDIRVIEGILQPLFGGMDIPISITMLEFYEKTQIELHMYTTRFSSFDLVDISYKTHPEWRVVEAVYASAALPIFFTPLEKDGEYYVDGGVFLNYPLGPCLSQKDVDPNTVVGIRKTMEIKSEISSDATLFDYILLLLNKIFGFILSKNETYTVFNEIPIRSTPVSIYDLYKMASSESARAEWIEEGVERGRSFCSSISTSPSSS
jgi:NTE family protein